MRVDTILQNQDHFNNTKADFVYYNQIRYKTTITKCLNSKIHAKLSTLNDFFLSYHKIDTKMS